MDDLRRVFYDKFGREGARVVRSPLRICPLGAHVDHQHGLVTGMALEASVNMMYAANDDGYIRLQSRDFPDEEIFHLDTVPEMIPGFWGNYVRGSVLSLSRDYKLHRGINAVIRGLLPIGGLSSSAAVTTAYLMALCDVNEIDVSTEQLIAYSHWVEKEFIGLNNGILDQSANILSRDGHLMYMDCRTEDHELVPNSRDMPEFDVVIVYSGITRALIGTDYNNRVDECRVAASVLEEYAYGKISPLREVRLRDVDEDAYHTYREQLPGRFRRRADHFFTEIDRVRRGVHLWREGDLAAFGQLMFESGESSISNYECGSPELITIHRLLREAPGVYGARFSGAGYRGCCIGLVDPAYREQIQAHIEAAYPRLHPAYKDAFRVYFCRTDNGARIVPDPDDRAGCGG